MLKRNIILIVILFAFIVFSGVVFVVVFTSDRDVLRLEEGGSQELTFECKNMVPGEETQVNYVVKGNLSNELVISLREGAETELYEWLEIEIEVDGKTVCEGKLEECFGQEYKADVKDGSNITFRYKIGLDVGNEAQGKKGEFSVQLSVGLQEGQE